MYANNENITTMTILTWRFRCVAPHRAACDGQMMKIMRRRRSRSRCGSSRCRLSALVIRAADGGRGAFQRDKSVAGGPRRRRGGGGGGGAGGGFRRFRRKGEVGARHVTKRDGGVLRDVTLAGRVLLLLLRFNRARLFRQGRRPVRADPTRFT